VIRGLFRKRFIRLRRGSRPKNRVRPYINPWILTEDLATRRHGHLSSLLLFYNLEATCDALPVLGWPKYISTSLPDTLVIHCRRRAARKILPESSLSPPLPPLSNHCRNKKEFLSFLLLHAAPAFIVLLFHILPLLTPAWRGSD
jgi:hypothetical protein